MKTKLNKSLLKSLRDAKSSCNLSLNEEQGGFILKALDTEEYKYIPVRNQNTGTLKARGLYIADRLEFGKNVLGETIADDWDLFASFHTHPWGCPAMPSSMDLAELFTSFPVNFIYAPESDTLNMFTYIALPKTDPMLVKWQGATIIL